MSTASIALTLVIGGLLLLAGAAASFDAPRAVELRRRARSMGRGVVRALVHKRYQPRHRDDPGENARIRAAVDRWLR